MLTQSVFALGLGVDWSTEWGGLIFTDWYYFDIFYIHFYFAFHTFSEID